jgi:hypothetical protein
MAKTPKAGIKIYVFFPNFHPHLPHATANIYFNFNLFNLIEYMGRNVGGGMGYARRGYVAGGPELLPKGTRHILPRGMRHICRGERDIFAEAKRHILPKGTATYGNVLMGMDPGGNEGRERGIKKPPASH